MGIIQKLKNEGSLVFYADYRSGSLNDQITGLSPTVGGTPIWTGQGITFYGAARLIYASSVFTTTTLSIIALYSKTKTSSTNGNYGEMANIITLPATSRAEFFNNLAGSGGGVYFFGGQPIAGATVALGMNCVGVSHTNGVAPVFYGNGLNVGSGVAASTITAGNALIVGNYKDPTYPVEENYRAILFFSKSLSATEHAQVYAELQAMKWPKQPWTRFKLGVETAYQNWKTDFGVRRSVTSEGGTVRGYLSNTPFQFGDSSGRWSINTSTVKGVTTKNITCSTAGILYLPTTYFNETTTEAAYGTWEVTINPTAANVEFIFISDQIGNRTTPATLVGYILMIMSNGRVYLQRLKNDGTAQDLFYTATGYCSVGTNYRFKINRSGAGVFTVWMDNALIVPEWGTNPVTDNTVTTSNYMNLVMNSGDVVQYSSIGGENSIIKKLA